MQEYLQDEHRLRFLLHFYKKEEFLDKYFLEIEYDNLFQSRSEFDPNKERRSSTATVYKIFLYYTSLFKYNIPKV